VSLLKQKQNKTKVFFLIIGGLLSHFYLRKRRERKKRDEHRWKVWQFKDMQRTSQPPLATTRTIPTTFPSSSEITLVPSRAPTHVTFPTQMSETAATGPKYPVKIYGAGFNGV
jgi:hypothetical protein